MNEDVRPDAVDTPEDEPSAETAAQPERGAAPAARAASRARRIGGARVAGSRRPAQPAAEVDADVAAESAAAVSVKKDAVKKDTGKPDTAKKDTAKKDSLKKTVVKEAAAKKDSAKKNGAAKGSDTKGSAAKGSAAKGSDTKGSARSAEATLARLRWLPAALLALAALVLGALCIVFGHGVWWGKPDLSTQRQQVLAAAKTCIAATTSYDYRDLKKSEAAGVACSYGTFQAQYKQAMETVVTKLAPQSKTVQTFQVADAGVESVSADGKQWVILLYGQQSVTNTTTGTGSPRLDILSARATLNQIDGKWLVVKLERV